MDKELGNIDARHPAINASHLDTLLPTGFILIPGSVNPPPDTTIPSAIGMRLLWRTDHPDVTRPFTHTFQARPRSGIPIPFTAALTATLRVTQTDGVVRDFVAPAHAITVTGPCESPTPTVTLTPPPSPTPIPTATPEPTRTRSATPTPTAAPRPLFLPLALRERCVPDQRRLDVVLVIDASSSMRSPTSRGRSKLDAAKGAARAFLANLRFEAGDQAALVAFSADAVLVQPLTADPAALDGALDRIDFGQQTCLVCGVDAAAAEIAGPRRAATNAAALVLLTDGRSNPQPAADAVARAAEAKAAGVTVFTIGLGDDLDVDALVAMASREPGTGRPYYYHAPEAEELAGIYGRIAVDIPCPPGAFWGRR